MSSQGPPPSPRSAPKLPPAGGPGSRWLWTAIAFAGLLGLFLRVPEWTRPFDRQFDGFQGAFFATAAVGYEQNDLSQIWPYPIVQVNAPLDLAKGAYLYANHPPLVPQLARGALALLAPRGWDTAWQSGRSPRGIEGPLRAPFVVCQLAAAVLFGLALARLEGRRAGALLAVLVATAPASLVYAGLVNYENPSLLATACVVWVLVDALCAARVGARHVALAFGAGLLAALTTYMPLLFAAPLGIWALAARRRAALLPLVGLGVGSIAGLVAHALLARRALENLGRSSQPLVERARELVAPLLDGSVPLGAWFALQAELVARYLGPALLLLALSGVWFGWRQRNAASPRVGTTGLGLALALLAGGAAVQFAFYRHTSDPQEPFLLHLVPGVALFAALGLESIVRRAGGSRLATALFAATVLLGAYGAQHIAKPWRDFGPDRPGPRELGDELARLAPAGAVLWYPAALGFTPAVGFYAWRTLLPVEPPAYGLPPLVADGLGLAAAPVFFVEPLGALADEPAVAADVARMRADLFAHRPGSVPFAEGTHFRLFALK
ncbi:MAG: hypothetical protein GC161_02930 [Planctomycetaceae bacterium]|nr:hypothetical protein [Planctomycetaceae bacterium]